MAADKPSPKGSLRDQIIELLRSPTPPPELVELAARIDPTKIVELACGLTDKPMTSIDPDTAAAWAAREETSDEMFKMPRPRQPRVAPPVHRPAHVQLVPSAAGPEQSGQVSFMELLAPIKEANLALVELKERVARIEASTQPAPPVRPPADDVGKFVYDRNATYTKNFKAYLALLPPAERMWLPEEEKAKRQTLGTELVANYRDKYPGSESLLLRIVYTARRKPEES
jgi:hypothetical protein